MPATNQKKVKRIYHIDSAHEEYMQAAKHDVKLHKILMHIVATLHEIRPKLYSLKLTLLIIRFLMKHCGIAYIGMCTRR